MPVPASISPPFTPAQTCPIWVTSVDASTFDADGKLKFNFSVPLPTGNIGPDHLIVQLTKFCEDANFKWWPLKDCRPRVALRIIANQAYVSGGIPATNIHKIFTFDASLSTIWTKNDPECLRVDLKIQIFAGTDALPTPIGNGNFNGPLGLTGAVNVGSTPVYAWTMPFQFCCHDCKLTCIYDPPPPGGDG